MYCGISSTTLSRAKVIATLMGACIWHRCTPVSVPHCLAREQTQAYTSDVSKLELPPSSGYPIPFHVISQQHSLLLACCSISMPSRDRGSTWQHGCGPEGKIRGRWGQFAIPVSVPQTRSPSLYSRCSQHVARECSVTLVNVTGLRSFAIIRPCK